MVEISFRRNGSGMFSGVGVSSRSGAYWRGEIVEERDWVDGVWPDVNLEGRFHFGDWLELVVLLEVKLLTL